GILGIKEIIEYRAPTDVPMMPPALRGVINLRGAVVPVVDLQQRFGRDASAITKRSCIVIVEIAHGQTHQVLGLLVDAVSEVLEI
ncbi:MAG: chemotaxis protein CheW, partial [Xanthomonas perforans]|nr:chemotaxis protein CheW [Xanthomonas perforans]